MTIRYLSHSSIALPTSVHPRQVKAGRNPKGRTCIPVVCRFCGRSASPLCKSKKGSSPMTIRYLSHSSIALPTSVHPRQVKAGRNPKGRTCIPVVCRFWSRSASPLRKLRTCVTITNIFRREFFLRSDPFFSRRSEISLSARLFSYNRQCRGGDAGRYIRTIDTHAGAGYSAYRFGGCVPREACNAAHLRALRLPPSLRTYSSKNGEKRTTERNKSRMAFVAVKRDIPPKPDGVKNPASLVTAWSMSGRIYIQTLVFFQQ